MRGITMKLFVKEKRFYAFLLFVLLILLVPHILRHYYVNNYLMGEESYYFLRIANEIRDKGAVSYDELSYGGRPFIGEIGWPLLLSIAPNFLSRGMPLIFGVLSFILFYLILLKITDKNVRTISSIMLLFSPTFILLFSVSSSYCGAVLFALLGAYLFLMKKEYFAIISFGMVGFFSLIASFFVLIGSVFYLKRRWFWLFFLNLLLLIQMKNAIFLKLSYYLKELNFLSLINSIFFEFNGECGIPLFVFILFFIGAWFVWKGKKKLILVYFLSLFLLLISFWFEFLVFYLNFFFVVIGAYGLNYLVKEWKWKDNELRHYTIAIFLCGVIFSGVAFFSQVAAFAPNYQYGKAMEFLSNNEKGIVFSVPERGQWISYTGNQNFMDTNYFMAPNLSGKRRITNSILYDNDFEGLRRIIEMQGIKYFWIDKNMKERVWKNKESGLWYILKYSKSFVKLYENSKVEIWAYLEA